MTQTKNTMNEWEGVQISTQLKSQSGICGSQKYGNWVHVARDGTATKLRPETTKD